MTQSAMILFLLGAVLGTLGDSFHVFSGTDGYSDPTLPIPGTGQPFWVPLLFGTASLLIGLGHFWARHQLPKIAIRLGLKQIRFSIPNVSLKTAVIGGIFFQFHYWASGYLPLETGGAKDLVLLVGSLLIWGVFDQTGIGIGLALVTAAIGTAFEMMLTQSGAFYYLPQSANWFGVPSWLPWLYIAASIAVGNTGQYLMARFCR